MKAALLLTTVILAVPFGGLLAPSIIDPAYRFGWSENIGWTNVGDGDGLGIHATGRDSRPLDHLSYY